MADINHKLENKLQDEKSIQRPKKERTPAQIEATKKMLEGRKKWAENKGKENKAKKVAKLKEKIAKIDPQEVQEVIEEEANEVLSQSIIDEPMETDIEDIGKELSPVSSKPPTPPKKVSKSKPKGKKKVKQVVNNYHYEAEESEEEEEHITTVSYTHLTLPTTPYV